MEYYRIGIGRLKILSNENVLMVNDFCFTPKYSKEEFNKRIPYETDWFELTIAQLVLKGFDLDLYEESGMFGVDTLSIIQPEVTIFRDKHTADPPFKYKPLFGSSIRGIPAKVNIPNIILSNGHLIYQEISEKGTIPGQIELNDLSISGSNLTNDSTRWIDNPVFSLILDAKLNGKGELNMNMDVIIPDSNDTFTVTGALGKMPLISLNTFIENNLFVSIESGELKKMAFSFVSDDDRSYGSMDFEYTDLKGVLIDPGNNKNKKLVSAAVNTFIRNDNIKDTRGYKKGKISVERRKDKGFANYLLKSLLSGMTSSAVPLLDKKQEKAKDKKEQKKRK
jgi:hypothetical protein